MKTIIIAICILLIVIISSILIFKKLKKTRKENLPSTSVAVKTEVNNNQSIEVKNNKIHEFSNVNDIISPIKEKKNHIEFLLNNNNLPTPEVQKKNNNLKWWVLCFATVSATAIVYSNSSKKNSNKKTTL